MRSFIWAAIAGRLGHRIDLDTLDRMGKETPVLLDLKPTGAALHGRLPCKAGGMATLLRELKPLLHLDALTVTGRTLGEEIELGGPGYQQDVVRSFSDPIYPQRRHGGVARQSRARRCDHQAIGCRSGVDGT